MSEVKLSLSANITSFKAEGSFDVLLDYFLLGMFVVCDDLGEFVCAVDSHATSIIRRLNYPYITDTIYLPVLWEQL